MAMIKCPDCKTPISDSADRCPRCGCNFQWEYQEMLRLRREIPAIERATPKVYESESAWSGGLVVTALIGLCVFLGYPYICDLWGSGFDTWLLSGFGLLVFIICACFQYGMLQNVSDKKSENARHNEDVRNQKASLAGKQRRLAELEAKFR